MVILDGEFTLWWIKSVHNSLDWLSVRNIGQEPRKIDRRVVDFPGQYIIPREMNRIWFTKSSPSREGHEVPWRESSAAKFPKQPDEHVTLSRQNLLLVDHLLVLVGLYYLTSYSKISFSPFSSASQAPIQPLWVPTCYLLFHGSWMGQKSHGLWSSHSFLHIFPDRLVSGD